MGTGTGTSWPAKSVSLTSTDAGSIKYLFNQLASRPRGATNEATGPPDEVKVCGPTECLYVPRGASAHAFAKLNGIGAQNMSGSEVGTALGWASLVTGGLVSLRALPSCSPCVPRSQSTFTNIAPKNAHKKRKGNLDREELTAPPSACKEKREILCFDNTGARTYIGSRRASVHIVSRKELIEQELATITEAKQPVSIRTENGLLKLTEVCQIYVKDMKVQLWAYILDDTVSLLSLGLLVDELGYSYIWNPRRSPILRKGKISVRCHPTNNVPHIYPGALIEDASDEVKSESLPPSEHPGTDEDRLEGQPELNESSSCEESGNDEGGEPSSAASLA